MTDLVWAKRTINLLVVDYGAADEKKALAIINTRLNYAAKVVADLLEAWPADSLPAHDLCLRAASIVNATNSPVLATGAYSTTPPK